MSFVQENRYGRFSIPTEVIRDNDELVQSVLSTTVTVRAEHLLAEDRVDYTAYSPLFEPVPAGEVTPEYDMNVTDDGGVVWSRIS